MGEGKILIFCSLQCNILLCLVKAYEDIEKLKDALKILYRIENLYSQGNFADKLKIIQQKIAKYEFQTGNLTKAVELYNNILKENPNSHESIATL